MTLSSATFSQASRPYAFIGSETDSDCFDQETLASGAGSLSPGSVLGRLTKRQAAAPIPTIVGTGSGVMTLLTFGPDVQVGSYVITLLATSSTAAFSVVAPDGTSLPNGAVGTAYKSNHLSFLISDGGTMTTGDKYTVAVTAGGTPTVVGGTGTGVMSAISLGPRAQLGTYKVINRAVVANGGDFEVLAPDGSSLGRFLMGTASTGTASFSSDHVNFTLSDATDYILGNYFNIIVATHSGEMKLWDPLATDGTQEAVAILTAAADATSASVPVTVLARDAQVVTTMLAWKASVTAAQKVEAFRQLARREIIARALATAVA